MPGNATLWDASPDGRLVIAHTDDRAVVIAHRPGDVDDRDLSWLDSSWVADLSHDGRLLLFTEGGQGGGSERSVYLRGTDGSPAVRLGAGRAVALSPDTRWAICRLRQPSLSVSGAAAHRRWRASAVAGPRARLYWARSGFPTESGSSSWAIEPGHQPRLYLQELEQGLPKPLTPEGMTSWALSPDGSTIAARRTRLRHPPVSRRRHGAPATCPA